MKKITAFLASAITALTLAAPVGASSMAKTLIVAMHDPGCHWFLVHGKYLKQYTAPSSVALTNMDETTLKVVSRHGLVGYVKVGKSLKINRGNYVVMMVGQAVDDNYLKLTVR